MIASWPVAVNAFALEAIEAILATDVSVLNGKKQLVQWHLVVPSLLEKDKQQRGNPGSGPPVVRKKDAFINFPDMPLEMKASGTSNPMPLAVVVIVFLCWCQQEEQLLIDVLWDFCVSQEHIFTRFCGSSPVVLCLQA